MAKRVTTTGLPPADQNFLPQRSMMTDTSPQLWTRVSALAASSAFLLYLADVGSERLSLTQAAFFMLAATADAAGKPATRSQLIEANHENFRGSIRNSYRQLLEPSRVYPTALGWLKTEANPMDTREQFLRLSQEGRDVIEAALLALAPVAPPRPSPRAN